MRKLAVYRNGVLAGTLTEENRSLYVFTYDEAYFNNVDCPAISLTLPKQQREYRSVFLFPFFFNLLSEGFNRKLQSAQCYRRRRRPGRSAPGPGSCRSRA